MKVIDRIRAALDVPRFCSRCGQPISVTNLDKFNPATGERSDWWYWHCPKTYVSRDTVSQTGGSIHPHGSGRPRWHLRATLEGAKP